MFKLGNNYLDPEDKEHKEFLTPRRAICPKCGAEIVRRVEKGQYYFEHCRRIWK